MNTNTKKAILVFSGVALMGTAEGYVPVQKERPSNSFIESMYLHPKRMMGVTVMTHAPWKSEQRKEWLKKIRENEAQMARMQKMLDSEPIAGQDEKLEILLYRIEKAARQRISDIAYQRSRELGVPKRYIKGEIAAKRQGVLVINNFEI